jgi:hypothetical protein
MMPAIGEGAMEEGLRVGVLGKARREGRSEESENLLAGALSGDIGSCSVGRSNPPRRHGAGPSFRDGMRRPASNGKR